MSLAHAVVCGALIWEALYQCARIAIRAIFTEASCTGAWVQRRERLINEGPSYVNAFLHAVIVACLGVYSVFSLLYAPVDAKMRVPSASAVDPSIVEYREAAVFTESTNLIFLSWLCYDIAHLLIQFPTLGGVDTLVHHVAFACSSAICASYSLFPFPFSWLIACELSSPFLNIRWYLLTTGRKDTPILATTNLAFGYTFVLTRVIIYGIGLAHLWMSHGILLVGPEAVPAVWVYLILSLVTAGYGLQLFWFKKILSMSKAKPKS